MPRVPSDDEHIASVRAELVRSGGTRRLCVRLPDDDVLESRLDSGTCERLGVTDGDVVRLVCNRDRHYARVTEDSRGRLLRGAYANARLARTPGEGTNYLDAWIVNMGGTEGDVVVVDVLEPGDLYGLRAPGERTVYDVRRGPRSSLADIANELDG